MSVPKYDELLNPLLNALQNLGSSASIQEQEDEVASLFGLSEKDLSEIHKGNRTKFSYRLAWARTYLKRYGLLDNSSRGVWALTPSGHKTESVDPVAVKRLVVALDRKERKQSEAKAKLTGSEELGWEDQLIDCVPGVCLPTRSNVSVSVYSENQALSKSRLLADQVTAVLMAKALYSLAVCFPSI